MTNSTEQPARLNSHETRHRNTERRIRQALDRLVAGASLQGPAVRLTVAALAREARVSRNTIYTEHSVFLNELASISPPQRSATKAKPKSDTARYQALIRETREQMRLLATENAGLLKRVIDAEKAVARLERQNAKLIEDLRKIHRLRSE